MEQLGIGSAASTCIFFRRLEVCLWSDVGIQAQPGTSIFHSVPFQSHSLDLKEAEHEVQWLSLIHI